MVSGLDGREQIVVPGTVPVLLFCTVHHSHRTGTDMGSDYRADGQQRYLPVIKAAQPGGNIPAVFLIVYVMNQQVFEPIGFYVIMQLSKDFLDRLAGTSNLGKNIGNPIVNIKNRSDPQYRTYKGGSSSDPASFYQVIQGGGTK